MQRKTRKRGILTTREEITPPAETNAERFYYHKQMEAGTELIVAVNGPRELRGRLLWYDENSLCLERNGRETLIARREVRYLSKAPVRGRRVGE